MKRLTFRTVKEQIHALDKKYSNNASRVLFLATSDKLNGGAIFGFKYSFMSFEWAYLLITHGDNVKIQNAFEFSLAHERGHLNRMFLGMVYKYKNKGLAHWIDEVLSDIAAFHSLNKSEKDFRRAAWFKVRYSIYKNVEETLKYDDIDTDETEAVEALFKWDSKDHPSWEKRCKYINMLQDHSVDEILKAVQDDYQNYISGTEVSNEGPSNMM